MGTYTEEEDDQFFDTWEEISSVSDWESACCDVGSADCVSDSSDYDVWTRKPDSVNERRSKFLKWMGLSLDHSLIDWEDSQDVYTDKIEMGMDRIEVKSGAVLTTLFSEDGFLSGQSFMSCQSDETMESMENSVSEKSFVCAIKGLEDDPTEFTVDELGQDKTFLKRRPGDRLVNIEDFKINIGSSPLVQKFFAREVDGARESNDAKKKERRGWLQKLAAAAHICNRHGTAALKPASPERTLGARKQRVRVHAHKKRVKEFSGLYIGQELLAHNGSILTTKFSLDGHYLASAGEDRIVRVWKVIEEETLDKIENSDMDSSCHPFTIDHLSKSPLLKVDQKKLGKIKKLGRSSNLTCTICPPKVFRIMEKPLHEFKGHNGEVLDLSWSKEGCLLSSSVDMTVRLWKVGRDRCLRVFSHNNYVTCVSFNPVDDDYFISGSIDGKIRIWQVSGCKVVDYIDIREIVTAVCYRPDGKGLIVGSMTGNCHFYDIIDNHLQLDAQVFLQSKKKVPGKKITGFQFCPSDPTKVMVSSANSLVRILCGIDVICKFRGFRNAGSQISASFTSDGKHIVAAGEDSNVLMWNYNSHEMTSSRAKSISSFESFVSPNCSIAIPWCGITKQSIPVTFPSPMLCTMGINLKNEQKHRNINDLDQKLQHSSPDCFSLSHSFLLESSAKGTATWPEEKLINSIHAALSPAFGKSDYKKLKSACQSLLSSLHTWGLVIVTAGWDGRIRTYHNYGLPICQ